MRYCHDIPHFHLRDFDHVIQNLKSPEPPANFMAVQH
jgi:hypothetical protein